MAMILETEARLTAKNQITIPASIRKLLRLQGGKSRVKFQVCSTGKVLFIRAELVKRTRSAVAGMKVDLDGPLTGEG